MRDIMIAAVCGIAMCLLPNTSTDNEVDAGMIRQVTRIRTVERCTDQNCPVTATVEVPAKAEAVPVVAATIVTRTVSRDCCRTVAPIRRTVRGTAYVASRPLALANRIRVNRMQARACRGNWVAQQRVGNRMCRGR